MARPIRVLVVDDSGFMRLALKKMLESHNDIEVVAEAVSGEDAFKKAKLTLPDVITMDVEMPDGSGIWATKSILSELSVSIIMISSLTKHGADETLQALGAGAVDFISKASSFVSLDIARIEQELVSKIAFWSKNKPEIKGALKKRRSAQDDTPNRIINNTKAINVGKTPELIVIGVSTGGPKLLPELFAKIDKVTSPIVIALHMPPVYTESFAENLSQATGHNVIEGRNRQKLLQGDVIICPGGNDTFVEYSNDAFFLSVKQESSQYSIHPSVNALFKSATTTGRYLVGVILTGMGDDGAKSCRYFKENNLPLLAQDEASSLVYGMPKKAMETGAVSRQLNIAQLAKLINTW